MATGPTLASFFSFLAFLVGDGPTAPAVGIVEFVFEDFASDLILEVFEDFDEDGISKEFFGTDEPDPSSRKGFGSFG